MKIKKILAIMLIGLFGFLTISCGTSYAVMTNSLYELSTPPYKTLTRKAIRNTSLNSNYTKSGDYYTNNNTTNVANLALVGDLMCQGLQQKLAKRGNTYDFDCEFDAVKSIISTADFAIGNLETMLAQSSPFMSENKRIDNKPHCNSPAIYLSALQKSGFDALVNANNHNCDTAYQGIVETIDNMDYYNFMHTGLYKEEVSNGYLLVNVNGIKIAIMSYSEIYNTKDRYFTQIGKDVLLNKYSKEKVQADIASARLNGAEFIIVYNHWGKEYTNIETENQRKSACEIANAGADYIIGSHPHALQRYDILTTEDNRQVPVIYSMGNFISHMTRNVSKETIILNLQLTRNGDKIEYTDNYIPCYTFLYGYNNYTTVPLLEQYCITFDEKTFPEKVNRIKSVIGSKITCQE